VQKSRRTFRAPVWKDPAVRFNRPSHGGMTVILHAAECFFEEKGRGAVGKLSLGCWPEVDGVPVNGYVLRVYVQPSESGSNKIAVLVSHLRT
jgi:hypothetical protein